MEISRRNFLKVSTLAGGGLMLSVTCMGINYLNEEQEIAASALNKFLSIDKDGSITFYLTKHEMGQGAGTSISSICADELGADWSKVSIENADYDIKYTWEEMGTTGGSGSITRIWNAIREAGATAREMLRQAAANKWNVRAETLKVVNSFVVNPSTGQKLEFGSLAETASRLVIPVDFKLKNPDEYNFIGKPVKNRNTKLAISGKARFGIDMEITGMTYAAIQRCPVYKGKLKSYKDEEARKVEGVIDVFPITFSGSEWSVLNHIEGHVQDGVVVVANSTWSAFKAKKLLNIVWDSAENSNASMSSFEEKLTVSKNSSRLTFEIGDMENELIDKSNEILEVEYNNPHQSHALMEPINATVYFKGETCEVWVGTQDASIVNAEVAKVVGLPPEKVIVHVLNSGGSFGRRFHADSSMEAAFISKKINKPVKLTWSREDEIRNDHFHHYLRNYFSATITPDKIISGIQNKAIQTLDYAIWTEKWDQQYYFPNIRAYFLLFPAMVHIGAWRSTGVHSASLGKECLMDELANRISKDPIDFRLELLSREINLGDPANFPNWVKQFVLPNRKVIKGRYKKVLEYVKENGLWNKQVLQGEGKGFAIENFHNTVCAQIAEVSMDDQAFGFRVIKITAVVHCGQVINPHFAKGQIEGGIIWGLSALKYGGLEIEEGCVLRSNFHDNKVLRIDECPEIEVHFIESTESPTGLGEPGTPPLAPAVLNAIYNASGKRIRKIPVTKTDIEADPK